VPGYKHACFISYRQGQQEIKKRFISEFTRALQSELELLLNEKVYIDEKRLQGGDFFNLELARAIYESACYIIVYQPNYFDADHPYCTREYMAMCQLELERLRAVKDAAERNHSLIIPIILRGEAALPEEIKAHRQFVDFSRFTLVDPEISRSSNYAHKITEIASYIKSRCECLAREAVPFDIAEGFSLPDEEAAKQWLRRITIPRTYFPGAGGPCDVN